MRTNPFWDRKGIARKDLHTTYQIYPESGAYYGKALADGFRDVSGDTATQVAKQVFTNMRNRGGGVHFKGPHTYYLDTIPVPARVTAGGATVSNAERYAVGIKGDGMNTELVLNAGVNDSLFKNNENYLEYLEIKNLSFFGQEPLNTGRTVPDLEGKVNTSALIELAAKSCWIHHNRFYGAFDYAVHLRAAGGSGESSGAIGFYNMIKYNAFRTMNVYAAVRMGSNDSNICSNNTFGNVSNGTRLSRKQPNIGGVLWNGANIISSSGTLHADHNEMNYDEQKKIAGFYITDPKVCGAGIEFSGFHNWVTNNHIGGGGWIYNGYRIRDPFRVTHFLGNSCTGSERASLHITGSANSRDSRFLIIGSNTLQNPGKATFFEGLSATDEAAIYLSDVYGADIFDNKLVDEQDVPTMNNAIFEDGAPWSDFHHIHHNTIIKEAMEAVIYDTNNNGIYDAGDIMVSAGVAPPIGTVLSSDSKIKFIGVNASWRAPSISYPGDPVVYDVGRESDYNGAPDNIFSAGEPVIAGYPLIGDTLKTDSKLKFVDSDGDGSWDAGNNFFRVDVISAGRRYVSKGTYVHDNIGVFGAGGTTSIRPIGYLGRNNSSNFLVTKRPFMNLMDDNGLGDIHSRVVGPVQFFRNSADKSGDQSANRFYSVPDLGVNYLVVLSDILIHADWAGEGNLIVYDAYGNEVDTIGEEVGGASTDIVHVPKGFNIRFTTAVPTNLRIHGI